MDEVNPDRVRELLEIIEKRVPGRSVELRVPPHGAVQIVAGGTHRRGTPRAVIEMGGATWVALAEGTMTWEQADEAGLLLASGERTDLSAYLPL